MQTISSTKRYPLYVHKLRLESREGADVQIRLLTSAPRTTQSGWIVAKLVGASSVIASLLIVAARELVR